MVDDARFPLVGGAPRTTTPSRSAAPPAYCLAPAAYNYRHALRACPPLRHLLHRFPHTPAHLAPALICLLLRGWHAFSYTRATVAFRAGGIGMTVCHDGRIRVMPLPPTYQHLPLVCRAAYPHSVWSGGAALNAVAVES